MDKKLYRSKEDKKLSGLCGGLGEFLGIDPTIIRVLVVIGTFFTAFFMGIALYIALSIIVPEHPGESANAKEVDYKFVDPDKDSGGKK
ncbi:MAG TPA: PspC domain-containing protein [Oscillospiraceae bacterium]|nr:PspC domain-containing protein [Oscillospiraceae bacterium]